MKTTQFSPIDCSKHEEWKTVLEYTIYQPLLSKGDCSNIYLAKDKKLNQLCAIKAYENAWIHDNEQILVNELNGLQLFQPDGFCVKLWKSPAKTGRYIYLPVEFFNAGSVADFLRRGSCLPEASIRDVAKFLGGALSRMHGKKCLHRNINPKHILVRKDEKPGFSFGLTGFQFYKDISKTHATSFVGTLNYNAPETNTSQAYDYSADIWSVGITLYELAFGAIPLAVDNKYMANLKAGKGIPIRSGSQPISDTLIDLINKCLAINPKTRITAAGILQHDFCKGLRAVPGKLPIAWYTPASMKQESEEERLPQIPVCPALEKEFLVAPAPVGAAEPVAPIPALSPDEEYDLLKKSFGEYFGYYLKKTGKTKKLKMEIKTSLSPYKLADSRPLNKGGFGEIYICQNEKVSGKQYALKRILTEAMTDVKIANLLVGEIEIMADMRHSPFTIYLYDYFIYKNDMYLVLELCNGGDLDGYIRSLFKSFKRPPPIDELKLIAWNIASGLRDVHMCKIMHRDIKPKNILLKTDEKTKRLLDVKLCDFGLSRKFSADELFKGSTVLGTFDYFAPELYDMMEKMMQGMDDTGRYDNKVDVWAYGILLYFCAFGKTPLEVPGAKQLVIKKGIINYPDSKIIPKEYNALIAKCLQFRPEDRPTFDQILEDPFFSIATFPQKTSLAPYIKVKLIGESQEKSSVVYECRLDSFTYAMKEIDISPAKMKAEGKARLSLMIDALSRLRHSDHVLRLQEYFTIGDKMYLILDMISGGSLEKFIQDREIKKQPQLSVDQQKLIAFQVIDAIRDIHAQRMIHRGIHPRSIFVKTDPVSSIVTNLWIADFSSSRILAEGEVSSTLMNGSYLSPEILQGIGADVKSDIYSYGMLLYFILYGCHPTEYKDFKVGQAHKGIIACPPAKQKGACQELHQLIRICLSPDPTSRPNAVEIMKLSIFAPFVAAKI